ncbi:DUF3891 family protein [Dyadobacter sp.]|uniref:DUF3891 family protein n=1 Tax=Dyadobacter sp. TaxID=1914288 RepID=UPI003F700E2F
MIVNYTEKGWELISQRAHGLLAGKFCFHLKPEFRTKFWMETIAATLGHDDAFNELEEDDILLNEQGGPVNYKMRDFERPKLDKLLNMALTKSRYIALLTSRHIQFLYDQSEDPAVKKYCEGLKKQDQDWLKQLELTQNDMEQAYMLLQWCDALSLLICQKWVQPENRKVEIGIGPGGISYDLLSPSENVLTVSPWPFDLPQFDVCFDRRILTDMSFRSEAIFRKKFLEQRPELVVYQFIDPGNVDREE